MIDSYQSNSYRYGFNGKEKDESGEWGSQTHYDYGFRIYNPGIARFLSVDPLSSSYPYYTPYQFAGNTPIVANDLDGLEIILADERQTADGATVPDLSNQEVLNFTVPADFVKMGGLDAAAADCGFTF